MEPISGGSRRRISRSLPVLASLRAATAPLLMRRPTRREGSSPSQNRKSRVWKMKREPDWLHWAGFTACFTLR